MRIIYPTGTHIGPYEIVAVLPGGDAGAMSTVYLARLRPGYPGAPCAALKIAAPQRAYSDFLKSEEYYMSKFDHPHLLNILPIPAKSDAAERRLIYTALAEPNNPQSPWYIAVEYMAGGSLAQLLERRHRLRAGAAVELIAQAAAALAYMHSQHVVHLDIKPSNLLLRAPLSRTRAAVPHVVVSDFGIALALDRAVESKIYGTRAYMAPERARGTPPHARHDVFALGVVLYELLTGRLPYGEDAPAGMLLANSELPSQLNRSVSPELEELVLKAIALEPQDRYQSMQLLQRDLETLPDIDRPIRMRLPLLQGPREYLAAVFLPLALGLAVAGGVAALPSYSHNTPTPTPAATVPPAPTVRRITPTHIPTIMPVPTLVPTATPPLPTATPLPTRTA